MKNCLTSKGFDLHPTTCLSSNNKAYKLPHQSMPTQFRENGQENSGTKRAKNMGSESTVMVMTLCFEAW